MVDNTSIRYDHLQLQLFHRNVSISLEKRYFLYERKRNNNCQLQCRRIFWIVRNIQYDIKKIVEENNIDILCIQEHCEDSQQDSIVVKERFGLPHRCVFFNMQTAWANFGISIYSRYPIIRHSDINFNSEKNQQYVGRHLG